MQLIELNAAQRRQAIDTKQAFEAWRNADHEFRHSYRGSMHWRNVNGYVYLSRKYGAIWEQVGSRSAETEKIKEEYAAQRKSLRTRLTRLDKKLNEMARLNRAMGIGRVPSIAAKVLRKLYERDLLGSHVFVAGTHSLYAYESRSGVLFDSDLTTTSDIDFLWDTRQRFTFLMRDINERGVLSLLRQVDETFKLTRSFRAENSDPYLVEIIRPFRQDEAVRSSSLKLSEAAGDFEPAAIEGLQWLLNAPKFEEIVIAEDGKPLVMNCIDPRAFALHKMWLSKRPMREGIKRHRDRLQAQAVAAVAINYLGLQFDRQSLSAMAMEAAKEAGELSKTASEVTTVVAF